VERESRGSEGVSEEEGTRGVGFESRTKSG